MVILITGMERPMNKPVFDPNQPFTSGDQGTIPPESQPSVGLGTAFGVAQDLAPWNQLRAKTLDPAGVAVAEAGGKMGYPVAGAVAGTAIQTAPELMSSYLGLQGLYNSSNPYAQGITKTPQEIGQAMNAGEESAGISGQLP